MKPRNQNDILVPVSPQRLAGESGHTLRDALRVRVLREGRSRQPVRGVPLRYTVVSGPLRFVGRGNIARCVIRTNHQGEAGLAVAQPVRGYSLVAVELVTDPSQRVFFEAATEGVVDRLSLYVPSLPPAPGRLEVQASAVDFHGDPVLGAELLLGAVQAMDTTAIGKIREGGQGRYRGSLKLERTGCWTVTVQDHLTRRSAQTCIRVAPGEANRIRFVGETDPRRAEPYNEVVLRARLEDRFGNALNPQRLVCRGGKGVVKPGVLVGDELQVTVRAAGYTTVSVALLDRQSAVRASLDVRFSAVWLSDPGAVFANEPFAHRLFVIPPPGRQADHGTIEIRFNPKLVRFSAFTPSHQVKPKFEVVTELAEDLLTISLEGKLPVTAEQYPRGIEVGELSWVCRGEGAFCFSAVAHMSPSTPPWQQCPDQKRRNRRSLCLNIIYDAANPAHRGIGARIAAAIETIIGSGDNVSRCCPILDVNVRYETIGNILINGAIGADGAVTTYNPPDGDFQKLFQALRGMPNSVIKSDCINMVLVPINAGAGGLTLPGPPGDSVVDPNTAAGLVGSAGAHEAGHALGLGAAAGLADFNDPANLMHKRLPVGTTLNAAQCRKIQETLGSYRG